MATKVAASIKKTAKAASKSGTKSVRSSKAISPALAALSNGLADAVARGAKLGSPAAELAAQRAVAGIVLPKILNAASEKRARTNAAKRFAGKLAAKKAPAKKEKRVKKNAKGTVSALAPTVHVADQSKSAAVNELKGMVLAGDHDAKREYDQARRTLAGLCKLSKDHATLRMGTPNLPAGDKDPRMDARVRNDQHAKRRSAIRSGSAVRQPYKGWQPTHSVPFEALSLMEREHAILKRGHLLSAQLKRETRDQRAKWNVSPKRYAALDQYKDGVRAVKGWSVWLWESGWLGGDGASTFHGTTTKPAHGKKDMARERDAQKREAQRRNGVRDGKEQLGFRADFERGETAGKPCIVPGCKGTSRKAFEARSVRGMESADGKAVCRTHGEILIAISRSSLDWTKKDLMVEDLLGHGQEPDPDLLASAKPAAKQYAKPVPAHAVNPAAVTAFIAAGAVLSASPSHNGHGQKSGNVPCMVCGENNAPAGPRWTWKVEVHEELKAFVADTKNSGRVCQGCGPSFFAISKKPVADQPAALAGMIAAKASPGKRPSATTPAMARAVAKEDFPGYVVARRQAMNADAQTTNDKPPCPIPGCELVLFKKNPFHSTVPGMQAAEGLEVCGVHVKALAGITHQNVTPDKRAELVNAMLHPRMGDEEFERLVSEAEMALADEPTGTPEMA